MIWDNLYRVYFQMGLEVIIINLKSKKFNKLKNKRCFLYI